MRRIAIIGAGQSGLQLGLGLLAAGYQVTLHSDRSAEDIRTGKVMSSQCMFDSALQTERDLGLDYWAEECPKVEGMRFVVPAAGGARRTEWTARFDDYAQSVDQRLKIPRWMAEFERRGGKLVIQGANIQTLEASAESHDLVIVATGKGDIGSLFARDATRSPFHQPQRVLAVSYVRNLRSRASFPAVSFSVIPDVGEYFAFPALTTSGPCEIMTFEGIPGGPMDCWAGIRTPKQHLARSKWILENFLPWEAEHFLDIELTDENGILTGGYTPVVRRPAATLPSGRKVLGMADAVVLNDPIAGQGANNAARCAELYLEGILQRGERPVDEEWMEQIFDRYWLGYARWAVEWSNLLLMQPRHVFQLLQGAGKLPAVATALVNGFDDPRTLFPRFTDAVKAEAYLEEQSRLAGAERFDRRDFRRALGQFATGVTVVTARGEDSHPIGVTVNSFSSVSLNPPLVLWSLARQSASLADFTHATRFAVNVLSSRQHHLSRQFATPLPDKFAGVEYTEGTAGVPLLNGAIAYFICRNVRQYDGGDHVIFLGEVEEYKWTDGEPLVFHSGRYRVPTAHPEVPE